LINCSALQRLKEIDQSGYRPLWVKPDVKTKKYDNKRFTHSVGVYLLLRKYKASLEEQISGLIHDVSHSAFSHCIDYVLKAGSGKEHNHQDNVFDEFVRKTEIPEILKKYNLDLEFILNDENFPLKEMDLPDLCADRIDYSLKDATVFEETKDGKYFIENLMVKDGKWIFKNFESAKKYAKLFLKLNTDYYAGFSSAVMFCAVGDCLRYALSKDYISEGDLYTTDKIVIEKVKSYINNDSKLSVFWERMNNKITSKNNPKDYDRKIFCKSRIVDPLCLDGGKIKRVSEIEPSWADVIKQESKPKEYFVKFAR
jgi:uncharacterized protein